MTILVKSEDNHGNEDASMDSVLYYSTEASSVHHSMRYLYSRKKRKECMSRFVSILLLLICYAWTILSLLSNQVSLDKPKVITLNVYRSVRCHIDYHPNTEFASYEKRPYTTWVESSRYYHYLQDEKEMMIPFFNSNSYHAGSCRNKNEIISFFNQFKGHLLKKCKDYRRFSHCQEHYLLQYDTDHRACHSYHHEMYINQNYTGVTAVLPLSSSRLDRLSLHFDRWKSPMSIAIQLNEEELQSVVTVLTQIRRPNVRFSLYIVKNTGQKMRCKFVSMNGSKVYYETCFVVNVLRNLAIETIRTTHFFIVDGDGLVSTSLESNIASFVPRISNENEVLVIPLLPYKNHYYKECIENGNCQKAWNHLPKTKIELLKHQEYVRNLRPSYSFFNLSIWKSKRKNGLMLFQPNRTMEPYGVFKRTKSLPLFHPYFINYGGNKEQYYNVLNTMNYHYSVMTADFAIDLPHPPSSFKRMVRNSGKTMYSTQQFAYFNIMFNEYCGNNTCHYFTIQKDYRRVLKKK